MVPDPSHAAPHAGGDAGRHREGVPPGSQHADARPQLPPQMGSYRPKKPFKPQRQPRNQRAPSSQGFVHHDVQRAAKRFARSLMRDAKWTAPPQQARLDYVHNAVAPLFADEMAHLLAQVARLPAHTNADDAAFQWFLLLRFFPYCVCGPTRGARSGSKQMQQRLERWRRYDWQTLYADAAESDAKDCAKRARRAARNNAAAVDLAIDNTEAEHIFARASRLARDGYYSRAAQALAGQSLAPADEATWRGLVARHPPALRATRLWTASNRWEWATLSESSVYEAAESMPRSAAMWLQPKYMRNCVVQVQTVDSLREVCLAQRINSVS